MVLSTFNRTVSHHHTSLSSSQTIPLSELEVSFFALTRTVLHNLSKCLARLSLAISVPGNLVLRKQGRIYSSHLRTACLRKAVNSLMDQSWLCPNPSKATIYGADHGDTAPKRNSSHLRSAGTQWRPNRAPPPSSCCFLSAFSPCVACLASWPVSSVCWSLSPELLFVRLLPLGIFTLMLNKHLKLTETKTEPFIFPKTPVPAAMSVNYSTKPLCSDQTFRSHAGNKPTSGCSQKTHLQGRSPAGHLSLCPWLPGRESQSNSNLYPLPHPALHLSFKAQAMDPNISFQHTMVACCT